jgi:chromodomain-helicase-DNA-binding protein 1
LQGLFAAFKVADFSAITRDDTASAAAAAAEQRRKAAAAHEAALAAVQKREVEDKELADDSGFWARLIPESERFVEVPEEKDDAAASAFGIVPARKAARAVQNLNENRLAQSRSSTTHGNASATAEKAAAAAAAAEKAMSREDRVARETLNARDVRVLLRGIMRFGWHDDENPPRFDDIVVQGKLQNKDRQTVLQAGSAVVRKARKVVADPPSAPPADEANASTAAAGDAAAKKTPKFDPMRFDFRGESVNAQQLVARIDGLTELRKRLVALGDNARSFRLPVTVKAPPNGWEVGWSPVDDAMLLIGVFKYGVGAWQQIRDEPQLRLTAKIQQNASAAAGDAGADGKEAAETAADPSKPGAAASHLSRRVDTLLRELCRAAGVTSNGASTSTPTAAATSSGASKAPPKRKAPPPGGSAAGAGGGAGGGAKSDAPKSKSAKTASKKSASGAATLVGEPIVSLTENEVENELYERARGYMATVKDTLKRMSVLPSRGDLNADEKRSRTRQYMLEVGAHIESVVEEKRTGGAFSVARLQLLRRHMWFYAASFTTTDSAQFEAAYRMLQVVAQKQQQQQQQQQH